MPSITRLDLRVERLNGHKNGNNHRIFGMLRAI